MIVNMLRKFEKVLSYILRSLSLKYRNRDGSHRHTYDGVNGVGDLITAKGKEVLEI